MDGSVVDAWDVMLSRGDPLEVAKAAQAVIGFCHAQQLRAFHQVWVEAEMGADPDGVVVDPTPPEVACAMVWTPGAASSMVDVAVDVVQDLPVVLAALAAGRIDLAKVREITRATLLVRLANLMLTRVRQRVAREQLGHRGRKDDVAWAHRLLLLRACQVFCVNRFRFV